MPLDPDADIARKAWGIGCPRCRNQLDCDICEAGRNCPTHWRYLLANRGRTVYLQCPACHHTWWHNPKAAA